VSNLQRILNLASRALDKKGSPAASRGSGTGSTDWRDLVRTAAEKVAGPAPAPSGEVPRDDRYAQPAPDARSGGPASDARSGAPASAGGARAARASGDPTLSADDRRAIARYDYLLATAEPAQLEQVHREAFARLTPAQREQVESRLRAELPAHEQPASASADDLARAATRGEAQRPGLLRSLFAKTAPSGTGARSGRGPGAGAALGAAGVGAAAGLGLGAAGGLLAAVAGGAVVSSVAAPLLEQAAGLGVDFEAFAGGLGDLGGLGGLGDVAADGLGDVAAGAEGFAAGAEGLAAGAGDLTAGATDAVAGVGEQATGFGEQLRDVGSNFEIPGLGGLGSFFDR
jgi:hypothetical protein